ncbi:hypothetical protein SUGI_0434870 [Cryptomeria japonica]|nr:hypothetical protein SUGI_0434870 [Cryptomeria japonica]
MNLSAEIFFVSTNQLDEQNIGESACTALVAFIAHWLQKEPNSVPIKSQSDTLREEGSLKWRKLYEVEAHVVRLSDGHFVLGIVLHAYILKIDKPTAKNQLPSREQQLNEDKNKTNFLPVTLKGKNYGLSERFSNLEKKQSLM